ncbi:MAG TPA: transporter [Hyphomicrobiaceae bacterium]|nr:transporter [Hyphomicrobiaceae bacterium]
MRNKLTAIAAAGVLSLCSVAPTYARSVTQPGELVGLATGAPLPPGLYFVNTADWGCSNTDPQDTCIGLTIPVVAWSTPWQILGARLQFLFAWPALDVGVDSTPDVPGVYQAGFYNPAALVQLAWDLGGGWGFSYAIGAYFDNEPGVSWSDTSLNQRIGLSYTGGGWNITANVVYGTHFDSLNTDNLRLVSPCLGRSDLAGFNCNPDFLNLDLTLTKTFGKWEFGPVAFGSWDVSDPANGYRNQQQFAVGGLIGYDFGPVKLQTYVTTDVSQDNYGGYDTRGWTRIIIPLGNPWPTPAPMSRR